ncbi:MAG TPA: hypothetical protein VLF59_01395 [Candidatus Saccharimonadales bacterium]|nr:hypothetical protein [Candidatus Saccharimonadales bacterium]
MHEELTVYHDLFGNALAVDYAKEAEHWVEFVVSALKEQDPLINGHSMRGAEPSDTLPYWHWRLAFNPANEQPAIDLPNLIIIPDGNNPSGIYLLLGATGDITAEQIATWTKAINEATVKLKEEETQTFVWEAVIGQIREVGGQQHYSLKSKAEIGGLTVRSGRIPYMSHDESTTPRFNSSAFNFSFPIIVEGTATGLDWQEASKQASRDLNKLVGLISVAWQSTWKILHSPGPQGTTPIKIPTGSIGMPNSHARHMQIPRKRKTVPNWLPAAFSNIDNDEAVLDALNMYHEGLLMELEHPSFALLAYVASIEAIGRKLLGKKAPNKKRFIAGLKTVIRTKKKVDEVAATYSPRSSTAHEAKLHGNENLFGYVAMPSVFNPAPSDMFWLTHMRRLRHVSCKALTKQLKGL